jgi:hypothetical protein
MDLDLERWLAPVGVEEFFGQHWNRQALVFAAQGTPRVDFDLDDFADAASLGEPTFPHVRVLEPNESRRPSDFTLSTNSSRNPAIDAEVAANLVDAGATLRVSDLPTTHGPTWRLASALAAAFDAHVNVNGYFSRNPARGIVPHYDPHHVFAVQQAGVKLWHLGEIIADAPSPDFNRRPTDPVAAPVDVELREGEMLYVPPGMWHWTETPSYSLHLTVGIHPPRWSEELRRLVDVVIERHPIARAELPLVVRGSHVAHRRDVGVDLGRLSSLLAREATGWHSEFAPGAKGDAAGTVALRAALSPASIRDRVHEALHGWLGTKLHEIFPSGSAYLRGSLALGGVHSPWDIDITVVTDGAHHSLRPLLAELAADAARSGLPPLDVTVVPVLMLEDPELTLRRILLEDAELLWGPDVLALPAPIDLDDPIVQTQLIDLLLDVVRRHLRLLEGDTPLLPDAQHLRLRSLAKAALRLASVVTLARGEGLLREPSACAAVLRDLGPSGRVYSDLLMHVVRGEPYDADTVVNTAEALLEEFANREAR